MRLDQHEKLQALSERLTDVFLAEADPDQWPGRSTPAAEMTKDQRGDRYWCKKNAVATISLIQRVGALVQLVREDTSRGAGAGEVAPHEDELDVEIATCEAAASEMLDRVQREQKKGAFDKRVNPKG